MTDKLKHRVPIVPRAGEGIWHTMPASVSVEEGEAVLESLEVRNFTTFAEADLRFAKGLNVIVGENGTGKTHLLKLPYAVMAMSAEEGRKRDGRPTKTLMQSRIAEKIVSVFRPEGRLGRPRAPAEGPQPGAK